MDEQLTARQWATEALGTGLLVFFAVGVATESFGFKFAGISQSAGVVATAMAFGFVLLVRAGPPRTQRRWASGSR